MIKIVLIGESGVGKTAILDRFISKRFIGSYKSTIGADFLTQEIWVDDKLHTLQIWDTAGQERFNSLGRVFYRGADCCFLVCDVTSTKSLRELKYWKSEFCIQADVKEEEFPFVVLANRNDCNPSEREISDADAFKWSQQNGDIPVFSTSAKTGVCIDKAFETAVKMVEKKRIESIPKIEPIPIKLGSQPEYRPNEEPGCKCT